MVFAPFKSFYSMLRESFSIRARLLRSAGYVDIGRTLAKSSLNQESLATRLDQELSTPKSDVVSDNGSEHVVRFTVDKKHAEQIKQFVTRACGERLGFMYVEDGDKTAQLLVRIGIRDQALARSMKLALSVLPYVLIQSTSKEDAAVV